MFNLAKHVHRTTLYGLIREMASAKVSVFAERRAVVAVVAMQSAAVCSFISQLMTQYHNQALQGNFLRQ
jgi:hypothetical protein